MASKKTKELATVGIKLNLTPTERDLMEKARALGIERRLNRWMIGACLEKARAAIGAARG